MKSILIIGAIILLAGCSREILVYSDADPDYDLWTYKTFNWGQKVNIEEGKNPLHYNELTDKQIKAAVRNELVSRGYELSEANPDLILHYHILVENKSAVVTEPEDYSYSSFWLRMQTQTYTYREGTLILDLMDSTTRQLIWRGWAVTDTDGIDTPGEKLKIINTVVGRIFKKFPRKATKYARSTAMVSN